MSGKTKDHGIGRFIDASPPLMPIRLTGQQALDRLEVPLALGGYPLEMPCDCMDCAINGEPTH
jgi:hypothetical protein